MQKSNVFYRHTRLNPPTAINGDGVYLIDKSGKRYLDASSGAAVSCLGHNSKEVTEAIIKQLTDFPFAHTSFFTSRPAEKLASRLIKNSASQLEKVYFVSGGSEAIESALKLSRQYFVEKGEPKRVNFIARKQSYHGNTLGALGLGGNLARKAYFQPILGNFFHHVDACHFWRWGESGENPISYGIRIANQLEQKILELGEETVIGFIAEPVVGATMGAVPATEGYFKRIREICDKYNILLILDEVMTGMGRTGKMFAYQYDGLIPDILCIAKGLGAGFQPIGATLVSREIYSKIEEGTGFFQHGHTYIGHATACAAGLAVLEQIERKKLLQKIKFSGNTLMKDLIYTFKNHPNVGNIRGKGLFVGIELVKDRLKKHPFDPELDLATKIKTIAFENGLICYPGQGTVDGIVGDHILLAPPYIFKESHIEELIDKLSLSLDKAISLIT